MTSKSSTEKLLRWRRTKIIATLGPATANKKSISQLIAAGVNVFRLNMSHGSHTSHTKAVGMIRAEATKQNKHIAILMDLCGPKIRVGEFINGGIELKKSASVTVTCRKVAGDVGLIPSQYRLLCKDVKAGDRILLDDGKMELEVKQVKDKELQCKVSYGGYLSNNKGMNLPDSSVSTDSFTRKDQEDARLAIKLDADFIALSFVRRAQDVKKLNRFLEKNGRAIPVIAKIEKPEAVASIDDIIRESYGIMIARGDLGIELPAQKVPLIQKQLINRARYFNCPVIVATQMLESMIENSRPTRAEVGDVANAALSSTDAVMLSAETATGQYPIKAVATMDSILREIERYQLDAENAGTGIEDYGGDPRMATRRAVAHAVTLMADEMELEGIVIPTSSGTTARVLSSDRPAAPLMGVSTNSHVCRKLSIHWGVMPMLIPEKEAQNWSGLCQDIAARSLMKTRNSRVLLVSGFHDDPSQSEPVLKLVNL